MPDKIIIERSPKTYIGWDCRFQLSRILNTIPSKRILLVADPALVSLNLTADIVDILNADNYSYELYTHLIPEPTVKTGQDIVEFSRNGNFSAVIGLGGGSAIDMAKLAAVFANNEGPLSDYLNLTASREIKNPALPKIFIPTTSGTGTEVTNISVVALEKTKDVIVHNALLADAVIIDPYFTLSLPPKHTAATGADALTHALEAFISVNANPYSDGLAIQSLRLIGSSLKQAVLNGQDRAARLKMCYGSYLAGLAFFNAGVGAIHALAYPLGGQFHIAHGESNAVLIPYVMNYIKDACSHKLPMVLEALGEVAGTDPIKQCIDKLARLMQDIGIPKTLADFGIGSEALNQLADDGIQQNRLLARCPMVLDKKDIYKIYSNALAGIY